MKILIEKIRLSEILVILVCGIGLILSLQCENKELAMALGGGLVGYLGGGLNNAGN